MIKRILILTGVFFLQHLSAWSQPDPAVVNYIQKYKDIAISEMIRTGVPASIKLAQGIHETEAGTSILVKKSNNHFGIKCKTDWNGMSVRHTDDAPHECFRKYESALDSYKDHSDFLRKSTRYAFLFNLDPTDYEGWAYGLKKAGYATNTKYPQLLIRLIEDYHLQDYTLIALGKLNNGEEFLAKQMQGIMPESNVLPLMEERPIEKSVVLPDAEKKEMIHQGKTEIQKPQQTPAAAVLATPAYPEGEFKINETNVVFVKKGTPYLLLAEKYNIPLARIFEFNELKIQEAADRDQLVYLMRKRKTGAREQHVVQEGESLNDIAQAEAIRLESLLELNHLKPGMTPAPGSVLYLKSKAPAMPALAGK
jgi:LysM repeat protein